MKYILKALAVALAALMAGPVSAATLVSSGANGFGGFDLVFQETVPGNSTSSITVSAPLEADVMFYNVQEVSSDGTNASGIGSGVLFPGETATEIFGSTSSFDGIIQATLSFAESTWNSFSDSTRTALLGTAAPDGASTAVTFDIETAMPDLEVAWQNALVDAGLDPADYGTFAETLADPSLGLGPDATAADAAAAVIAFEVIESYADEIGVSTVELTVALGMTDEQLTVIADTLETLGTEVELVARLDAIVAEINDRGFAIDRVELVGLFGQEGSEPFLMSAFSGSVGEVASDLGYVMDVSEVPLPAGAWLLLSGLFGILAMGRRKKSVAAV